MIRVYLENLVVIDDSLYAFAFFSRVEEESLYVSATFSMSVTY